MRKQHPGQRQWLPSRSIVEQLLNPLPGEDALGRIQLQNNITANMRSVPNYQRDYFVPEQQLQDIRQKYCCNLLDRIVPGFQLQSIDDTRHDRLIRQTGIALGYEHRSERGRFIKMVVQMPHPVEKVLAALIDPTNYPLWNKQVQLGCVQLSITSENALVAYQKFWSVGNSRGRDFVYVRHLFRKNDFIYMVDKSVQHTSFPQSKQTVRGDANMVLWVFQSIGLGHTKLICIADMDFKKRVDGNEPDTSTVDYLMSTAALSNYLSRGGATTTETSAYFDLNWDILKGNRLNIQKDADEEELSSEKQLCVTAFPEVDWSQHQISNILHANNSLEQETGRYAQLAKTVEALAWTPADKKPVAQLSTTAVSVTRNKIKSSQQTSVQSLRYQDIGSDIPRKSINSPKLPSPVQPNMATSKSTTALLSSTAITEHSPIVNRILSDDVISLEPVPIQLDRSGLAVLPRDYLSKRYSMVPIKTPCKLLTRPGWKNYFMKDQWDVMADGVLKCTNTKMMEAQNKILLFLVKKLGKSVFSGDSIMNISLPVSIFSEYSMLESVARIYGSAPIFLEKAANERDPVERMKLVAMFALVMNLQVIDCQKPFNPILGETFQGWIDGCPIYCEQISHHPPITSGLLIGRGYTVSGSRQINIEIGLGNAIAKGKGELCVSFERFPSKPIRFQLMNAEIFGLAFAQNKFRFLETSYFYEETDGYFLEMTFNAHRKGLLSFGRQSHPEDWIEGKIVKTTSQFVAKFRKLALNKREGPSKKEVLQNLGVIDGRWTESIRINGAEYLNVRKVQPHDLEYQPYPLNSNSNYREDIIYRRRKDLERSQAEKERLQVLQRGDQKLRQSRKRN